MTLADLPTSPSERSEQENLTYARLLLAQDQPQAALDLLRQIELIAQRQHRHGNLVAIYLLQAVTNHALHLTEVALDRLEQAICMAAPEGYRRVFLDEAVPIATLLADKQHIAPAFVASIREALSKHQPADRQTASSSVPPQLVEPLSETQRAVLRLVADGLSNRDIAARLAITEGTTKWHLNQIYGKLNVSSRTQAVAQARQLRLL